MKWRCVLVESRQSGNALVSTVMLLHNQCSAVVITHNSVTPSRGLLHSTEIGIHVVYTDVTIMYLLL